MGHHAVTTFLFILFTLYGFTVEAQRKNQQLSPQFLFEQAYEQAKNGDNKKAILLLDEAIKIDTAFTQAYTARAGLFAELHDYARAVADYKRVLNINHQAMVGYWSAYAHALAGMGLFNQAHGVLSQALQNNELDDYEKSKVVQQLQQYAFALDYDKKYGKNTNTPKQLSAGINTRDLEYFPSLTVDSKNLVFGRRVNRADEDIFIATYDSVQQAWNKAVPLRGYVNTQQNESAAQISQDGQWLVFAGCLYPNGYGSCDIYLSKKINDSVWGMPQNLGRQVNTEFWESSPSLSPDKRTIYFESTRPGGLGGSDIWVTTLNENNVWTKPKNLGAKVNTPGDEGTPFIHADNTTLYFRSNGHTSYGNRDIFKTTVYNGVVVDSAINLGYPINTIDDEGSFIVSADGATGYFASNNLNTENGLDIFSVVLPQQSKALKTTWLSGFVYDSLSKQKIVGASVQLVDINNNWVLEQAQTDSTGNYLITLPNQKQFALHVRKPNYLFYSDHFSLDTVPNVGYQQNIALQSIKKGANIILKNIFYPTNQFNIDSSSLTELKLLVHFLQENPQTKIIISGHTDDVGSPPTNEQLSTQRAKEVYNYLIQNGIAPARLQYEGWGSQKPIVPNNNENNRAKNRRTELTLE